MTCKDCKGSGSVVSTCGGIEVHGDQWRTYAAPVTCWRCGGSGKVEDARGTSQGDKP